MALSLFVQEGGDVGEVLLPEAFYIGVAGAAAFGIYGKNADAVRLVPVSGAQPVEPRGPGRDRQHEQQEPDPDGAPHGRSAPQGCSRVATHGPVRKPAPAVVSDRVQRARSWIRD